MFPTTITLEVQTIISEFEEGKISIFSSRAELSLLVTAVDSYA